MKMAAVPSAGQMDVDDIVLMMCCAASHCMATCNAEMHFASLSDSEI